MQVVFIVIITSFHTKKHKHHNYFLIYGIFNHGVPVFCSISIPNQVLEVNLESQYFLSVFSNLHEKIDTKKM